MWAFAFYNSVSTALRTCSNACLWICSSRWIWAWLYHHIINKGLPFDELMSCGIDCLQIRLSKWIWAGHSHGHSTTLPQSSCFWWTDELRYWLPLKLPIKNNVSLTFLPPFHILTTKQLSLMNWWTAVLIAFKSAYRNEYELDFLTAISQPFHKALAFGELMRCGIDCL